MGLLDRAINLENKEEGEQSPLSFLIKKLHREEMGMSFPNFLFDQLQKNLKLHKAALLLPERKGHFVPWAQTGFDRTTSRRIRIPELIIKTMASEGNSMLHLLEGEDLIKMRDYLSFREYSVTNRVLLAPISSEKEVLAILLISEGDIFKNERIHWKKTLTELTSLVAPMLKRNRDFLISKLTSVEEESESASSLIDRWIQEIQPPFTIVSIDLSLPIDMLLEDENYSLPFRIKEDMLRLIKTLVSSRGELVNYEKKEILILLKGEKENEAELLVHQIGLSLGYFYKRDSALFSCEYKTILYKGDKNLSQLISSLGK